MGTASVGDALIRVTRPIPALFLALTGAILLVVSPAVAALLAPAIVIGFVLSIGLFPGEELIARVRRGASAARVSARIPNSPIPTSFPRVKPAGLAIAFALANRPPPVLRLAS